MEFMAGIEGSPSSKDRGRRPRGAELDLNTSVEVPVCATSMLMLARARRDRSLPATFSRPDSRFMPAGQIQLAGKPDCPAKEAILPELLWQDRPIFIFFLQYQQLARDLPAGVACGGSLGEAGGRLSNATDPFSGTGAP
jgi:hypothetical protein